jgi:uncharacterized protein (DUF1501 family)
MTNETHDDCACEEYNELLSRRQFLMQTGGATGAALFAYTFPEWLPRVTLADSYAGDRDVIVSIFMRGGADGLSLCVPFGDPNYYTSRPTIAIPRPDSTAPQRVTALDSFFGLPPALVPLLPAYQAGHMLIVHGAGLTHNTRSHFDAQHYMEVGKSADPTVNTGWLGRHLATVSPMKGNATLRALGISSGLVDTLKGGPRTLPIPDPTNYGIAGSQSTRDARTAWFTAEYGETLEPLKAAALDAMTTISLLRTINFTGYQPANGAVYPNTGFSRALRSAAALIKSDIGVEAIHVDIGGWDTHAQQNPINGAMFQRMTEFAGGLGAFYVDVIASGLAPNVTVVVLSEFGRNVRQNGSAGTDHGRATAMFALGRGISGGRVLTNNWQPLARENLADGQDLRVTIDYRDILAEIVQTRLANPNVNVVFPGYTPVLRAITR